MAPNEKYETIRRPSAYCATSSGIAIVSRRVSTQPEDPLDARTRLQSSVGTGFSAGAFSGASGSSSRSVLESSSQLSGGGGGLGIGSGGIFGSFLGGFL